jgi:hypothetical protein
MANHIRGIDHVLIAASDLERSVEVWRRLGFVTTPYGRHVGKSTANYCIMFPKDYLELIGIVDPASPPSQHNDLIAARGDGLFATALSPDSAEAARQAVIDAGIEALPLRDLHRAVERPDGTADLYFKNFDLADAATPDYRFFFCHHLTPDEMRHPDWLAHPNGVVGVDGIVVVCPGPAAHADAYAKLFGGDAVGVDGGVLTIRAGRHRARFMTDAAFRAAYSAAELPAAPAAAYGASVGFLVRDVAATAAWLDRAGVAHVRTDGGILVAPGEATGVLVQFRAAA